MGAQNLVIGVHNPLHSDGPPDYSWMSAYAFHFLGFGRWVAYMESYPYKLERIMCYLYTPDSNCQKLSPLCWNFVIWFNFSLSLNTQNYCTYAKTSLTSLPRSCMHVVSWHWSVAQFFWLPCKQMDWYKIPFPNIHV